MLILMTIYGAGTSVTKFAIEDASQCCGGGAILINASRGLQLDGALSANAQAPCVDCTHAPSKGGRGCCDPREVLPSQQCDQLGGASGGASPALRTEAPSKEC